MRVAAIDCGTNSIRLLIADVEGSHLTDIVRVMKVVRLGEGVDVAGSLSPAAIERTWQAVEDYAEHIRDTGAVAVRMVATSASRDADNADTFIDGVVARLGVVPEVISGHEEAALSFAGAASVLDTEGTVAVVDIGGGSTEFVVGEVAVGASISENVGCVRMTERHLRSDPPTPEEIAAATADIDAAVLHAKAATAFDTADRIVGLAGSVTTVAALAMGLPEYDSAVIHGSRISADQVHAVTAAMLSATRAQRAAEPVMHPGRVDVIGGGALVLDRILTLGGFDEVIVSEHDILDGIALGLARRAQ
ncbi:MAG: Ppx/GppA family phosphatase [Actinobacteria bacterium]|nr:Ppx/GppA family phosphatase [Actinomycetota bacterium]MCB8997422.1 Ppx/GppA family phosphatase [Actinomycetota bacterium]MCB9414210.1 Ppx/GppA family phosphatase [Actinomycetota bacterium]HRY09537.1 Ppx/GppA phosphatase family protein [Candidatus Nanopelagicales bacterium]